MLPPPGRDPGGGAVSDLVRRGAVGSRATRKGSCRWGPIGLQGGEIYGWPGGFPAEAGVDPRVARGLPVPRRRGRVIYVGKAKSLRQRLNSYFADFAGLHPRTQTMLTTAAGVEWTVVGTEVEALQLEYSWIKEFDPRFNVKYRDDKSYPYLAVTMGEEFPRVKVMRGAKRKGTRYFGPYSHAWAIRETVDLLLRVFPVRTCSAGVFKRAAQIGRPVPARLHRQVLGALRRPGHRRGAPRAGRGLLRLHGGQHRPLHQAAGARDARGRRRAGVRAGRPAARRHPGAGAGDGEAGRGARRRHRLRRDRAGRGPARGGRPGVLRPRRPDPRPARLGGRQGRGRRRPASWSSSSSLQMYGDASAETRCPREVLVPALPPDAEARDRAAQPSTAAARVELRVPQRGDKKALMETVERNAKEALKQHKTRSAPAT